MSGKKGGTIPPLRDLFAGRDLFFVEVMHDAR